MKTPARVLIVDDDRLILQCCEDVLRSEGYTPVLAQSAEEGIQHIGRQPLDVIITDLKMADKDGLDVLRFAKTQEPDIPVVILTGYPTLASAIESVRLGAFDYLCKPLAPDELLLVVSRARENRRLVLENRYLRQHTERQELFREIIAGSPAMQQVLRQVERVAPTESTVLLVGESGTGKELLARAIHRHSPRRSQQFVVADCATLTPSLLESELFGHVSGAFTGATTSKAGLFEVADGGTLFLDEVASISLEVQSKLLRVLETQEYKPVGSEAMSKTDVRLIVATNRDLRESIEANTFRLDLFYRINVFPIHLPPLRERAGDIVLLAQHFLKHFAARANKPLPSFCEEAIQALQRHSWPGNVRELKNVVERIVIMTDGLVVEDAQLPQGGPFKAGVNLADIPQTAAELKRAKAAAKRQAAEEIERSFLDEALQRAGGNVTQAAAQTGMQRTYFQALMKKHGIRAASSRATD